MKIYIASFFDTRARLVPVCEALEQKGHQIVAHWIRHESSTATYATVTDGYRLACALKDMEDIRNAGLFIIDTLDETPRGGREVELGLALAAGLPCWRVGPARNVFHQLTSHNFYSWESCLHFVSTVDNGAG
jgi:Nucleoside 2-deoxyribosyltransferase